MFDPGDSTGRLRACSFLGAWRALVCGEVFDWAPDSTRGWSVFWQIDDSEHHILGEVQVNRLLCTYCGRSQFLRSQAGLRNSRLWKLRG